MRKSFSKNIALLMMAAGLVIGAPAGSNIFGQKNSGTVYAAETDVEETEAPPIEDSSHYDDYSAGNRSGAYDMAPTYSNGVAVYSVSGDTSVPKPSASQILAKYNETASVNVTNRFAVQPSVEYPYSIGKLDSNFLNSGYTFLNFYRYCATVGQVTLDTNLCYGDEGGQYGAVVLAANDFLTHYPTQPDDMPSDFYNKGYKATTSSNISKRTGYDKNNSFRQSIYGCMNDKNSTSNLTSMGHRRWFLNPSLGKVGFGYAESAWGSSYIVNKVFDRSATYGDYDFIAWPASGYFPNDIFDTTTPWSVTLNPAKFNTSASVLNSAVVKITRESDGKSWTITQAYDKTEPVENDMEVSYFHVDRGGYAIGNCIIFQIGSSLLGRDAYTGDYNVEITGLKTTSGDPAMLKYTVSFFGMGADMSKISSYSNNTNVGVTVYNGVDYSKVYDYVYYLIKYPDMLRLYSDNPAGALRHFVEHGMTEGRQAKASFDVISYKNQYPDLRKNFGDDLKKYYIHYMNHGYKEGRTAIGVQTIVNPITVYNGVDYAKVYDFIYYTNKYSDIKKYYGNDDVAALKHFVEHGMAEGRQGSSTFDLGSYKNSSPDLRRHFGNDNKKYYIHYMNYGYKEGRKAVNVTTMSKPLTVYKGVDYSKVYDFNFYINKYADMKKYYQFDDESALKHFVEHGMAEGRQGSSTFELGSYKNSSPDLRKYYGNDNSKYYIHYINHGYKENRAATGAATMTNPTTVFDGVDYSKVYDFNYYINKYPDMKKYYQYDDTGALRHFVLYGIREGRQASENFNLQVYRQNATDLQKYYGFAPENNIKYVTHYMYHGYKEGRKSK